MLEKDHVSFYNMILLKCLYIQAASWYRMFKVNFYNAHNDPNYIQQSVKSMSKE